MSSNVITGMRGRCPECGEGRILKKFLEINPCEICGLDLRESNPGDGLATLVFLLTGGLGCWGIIWSELAWKWPIWLEIVVWVPLIGILSIVLLNPFKGLMIALLHRTQAAEAVTKQRNEPLSPPAPNGGAPTLEA